MNFLRRGLTFLASNASSLIQPKLYVPPAIHAAAPQGCVGGRFDFLFRCMSSLNQLHRKGPHRKVRPLKQPLGGNPYAKGVVLRTLIKKPKKPNSANRKCVLVKLSNGKEMVAYVPGIGHNLQEHNIVLVRCGRLQDTPGVKLKCVRGKFDLPHVIKQTQQT